MKKIIVSCSLMAAVITATAQTTMKDIVKDARISGYAMTDYKYNGQDGIDSDNGFNIRLLRIMVKGKVATDFAYQVQLQMNGTTDNINGPRIVDCFAEWQKYDFFRVKVGQFKRAFTFENPMNPIDQGFMSNGLVIQKLSGMNDRVGEHACNGRDMGVQLQGDFLKNAQGRNLMHYQIGAYNGQGINMTDLDNSKDIIGGLWVMPVKGLRLGAFGWDGKYAHKNTTDGVVKVDRKRYALSGEYAADGWTLRSEYIHSYGGAFSSTTKDVTTLSKVLGNKADGAYALVIAPIKRNKLEAKARYDMYRRNAKWGDSMSQYELGANYYFNKSLQLDLEYAFVNDRSLAKHNYSLVDVQLDFRF